MERSEAEGSDDRNRQRLHCFQPRRETSAVQAVAGNVNCGSSTAWYNFTSTGVGYTVSPTLGGISTANGGNVNIKAGGNIVAPIPGSGAGAPTDFGSGAFGSAAGNVTLNAGGNVTGHFVLANGTGTINTGGDAGTTGANLALSLIDGGWTVIAAKDIYLQEVRNPNGVFNSAPRSSPVSYLFNYDPLASVTLNGGNSVTITGSSPLPRNGKPRAAYISAKPDHRRRRGGNII